MAGIDAGGPGGDDRPGRRVAAESLGLGADQRVAADDGIDQAALGKKGRPCLEGDLQEIEGDLEIAGVVLRREAADLVPGDAGRLHVVHQPGKVARQAGRRRRRRRG